MYFRGEEAWFLRASSFFEYFTNDLFSAVSFVIEI